MTINSWGSDEPVEVAKGGTQLNSYSTGDLIYASGANTWAKLAAGTDGHVLKLASGVPSWAAPSGGSGAWVYLNKQTASASSSINFDSTYITSTYDVYCVIWHDHQMSSDGTFYMRVSPDNGSNIRSSGYQGQVYDEDSISATTVSTEIRLQRSSMGGSTDEGHGIWIIYMAFPASSSIKTQFSYISGYVNSSDVVNCGSGYGKYDTAEAHNYLRFLGSSNIDTGTATLFGLAKS